MRFSAFVRPAAAAVCGGIPSYVNILYVHPFWEALGWRRPVAEAMTQIGLGNTMVGLWGVAWLHIPDWLCGATLGILTGLCASRTWFIASLLGALAFVLTPDVIMFVGGYGYMWTSFGWDVMVVVWCWQALTVVLAILVAFVSSRVVCTGECCRGPMTVENRAEREAITKE